MKRRGGVLFTFELANPKDAPGGCQCIALPNDTRPKEYRLLVTPAFRRRWARIMDREGWGKASTITMAQVSLRLIDAFKAQIGSPTIGPVSAARAEELTIATYRPRPGALSQPWHGRWADEGPPRVVTSKKRRAA